MGINTMTFGFENIFKKTLAPFKSSGIFTLHFAVWAKMAALGATDNCSPRWAQD
jgi:hypothetical protein